MDKTVVVQVEDHVKHPKYGKVLRRTKKYRAHDETNACGVGDRGLLMETRPLSATKRWGGAEIPEKAKEKNLSVAPGGPPGAHRHPPVPPADPPGPSGA